eukprot:GHRQ01024464.1.p1 GENE.GHRQ01024464.1~~GHRQ01024464.1.p1  ORF type:complete len:138 (-),score=19.68 GHRQ01024464.1:144-533(-)
MQAPHLYAVHVCYARDVLLYDGPGVQLAGGVVGCGANDLDTALVRPAAAREPRTERYAAYGLAGLRAGTRAGSPAMPVVLCMADLYQEVQRSSSMPTPAWLPMPWTAEALAAAAEAFILRSQTIVLVHF